MLGGFGSTKGGIRENSITGSASGGNPSKQRKLAVIRWVFLFGVVRKDILENGAKIV